MTSFLDMFCVALMPLLKVLLMTGVGLFLALDKIDILGDTSRYHLNRIVFYVFNPALIAISFAKAFTLKSLISLWFMPVNILLTYLIGSILGWLLGRFIKAPKNIKCVMLASCASGNYLALPIIIIPAMCQLKTSPFGTSDICSPRGSVYGSLSMAIGVTYFWSYTYNLVRIYPKETAHETMQVIRTSKVDPEQPEDTSVNTQDLELQKPMDSRSYASTKVNPEISVEDQDCLPSANQSECFTLLIAIGCMLKRCLRDVLKKMNLTETVAPSATAAIIGISIGMIYPIKKLIIGDHAPLRMITNTSSMIGDAAIPCTALILGANLLKGLRGCKVQVPVIIGIITVRYMILPLTGILIVKGAVRAGFVEKHDSLLQFSLMLHYALPPAMNLGTVTQLFGIGQLECSVIMLWSYALAVVAVTLWCALFTCLVSY